jgi:hypothetical protein
LRAFIWDSVNGMQNLGDLPGSDDSSTGHAINNLGQVVGYSIRTGGGAFSHAASWRICPDGMAAIARLFSQAVVLEGSTVAVR